MGESPRRRAAEVASLKLGLDLGMRLVDTAEMYGDGGAEQIVGEAIAGRRSEVFVVSKVLPQNAGAKSAIAACDRSLRRLRTDHLDLYLLHWHGRVALAETVGAFERLRRDGKILRWGVSNFDVADLKALLALPEGRHCATNQLLYHLKERGIEWELLQLMRAHAMPVMAYSPLGGGNLLRNTRLASLARSSGLTPAQIAVGWLLRHPDAIVIPKASNPEHIRELRSAVLVEFDDATLAALDAAFPPPSHPTPLAVI